MEHVYASVDIGSDSIKVVVCEFYQNHLNLLAATCSPSSGIKKCLIVEPEKAKDSIIRALKETEAMLGVRIKKVIVTVPCHRALYKIIKGECDVSGDLIDGNDIINSYKDGIKKNLNVNEEFVNIIPIDFNINGKTIIKDPKNFPGDKLIGRAMMITTPKKNVYSVATIVESIGVELADISVGSVGDINTFKSRELDENISAIINIGADITTVSLYNKGIPVSTKIIGGGGKEIDKDLAYTYRISTVDARKIKETFALADDKNANKNSFYEVKDIEGKLLKLNQAEVSKICKTRISEILSLAKSEIGDLTNKQIQYIIVTGGISNMADFDSTLNEVIFSAKKGKVKLIGVRNNKYSIAVGNIIYFINTLKLKGMNYSMLSEDDMDKLSSPKSNNNDQTVLGKVFGYFFGE